MAFDQEAFNAFIEENGVYGFFETAITLKSGRTSHFYANWRDVVKDVWLTEKLAGFVIEFVKDRGLDVDTFYGVPEGATKLGVMAQYLWAKSCPGYSRGSHALAMGRAKPKDHGAPQDRFFVGVPRGKVVVIEDVTTTGGSSLQTLESLKEAGIDVVALLSLTNRMEKRDDGLSVQQAAMVRGFEFYHMSTALELLPRVYARQKPGPAVGRAIESEFAKYGVEPLKLV
jgi:orotate phosphoribosyltransferase